MGRKPKVPLRTLRYMVLDYIKDHPEDPYITQVKVAQELQINPATLSKIIAVLLVEQKIKVIEVGTANILQYVGENNDG